MGGVILVASIIIWFLGYFPRDKERELKYDNMITQVEQQEGLADEEKSAQIEEIEEGRNTEHQEESYIGRVGKVIEPVMRPPFVLIGR